MVLHGVKMGNSALSPVPQTGG